MSINIYGYDYLANVSFLEFLEQARIEVKHGYVFQEE